MRTFALASYEMHEKGKVMRDAGKVIQFQRDRDSIIPVTATSFLYLRRAPGDARCTFELKMETTRARKHVGPANP